ncbi:MAG: RagB/SusD family nutrient uptake outer membrane protein [Candidatus Azobacteroides sp.]|nr:RagB/SusD family nutrient uptake outer membrane protein [Candidatus Azobacteroides sp.]
MKNVSIFFCVLTMVLTSCVKLNDEPADAYSSNTYFGNSNAAFNYLVGCYAGTHLGGIFNDYYQDLEVGEATMLDDITDNGVCWALNQLPYALSLGTAVSSSGGYSNFWMAYFPYNGIRNDNFFLENADNTPGLDAQTLAQWKAEARFLRAFDYARKYMFWGGVPLVTKVLSNGEELNYPRVSGDSIYRFVVQELDAVAQILPAANPNGSADAARATKGAALALKSRIELFHAGMKAQGLYDGITEPAGAIDIGAAINDYIAAANDAQAVINMGMYGLANDYEGLFLESAQGTQDRQREVIFEIAYQYSASGIASSMVYPNYTSKEGGWNLIAPTQSIVDEYETNNGKMITDPANTLYDPGKPYVNKDPRFYATILYPGKWWNDRYLNTTDPNDIEFYNSSETHHSVTGYCLGKWNAPQSQLLHDCNDWQGVNFIQIRYAEVLLNYAEAMIELAKLGNAQGNLAAAAEYINMVRQRGTSACVLEGFPKGITYYMPPISVSDASTMQKQLRHERRVEFAFEGLRWFDMKRWGIGGDVMPGDVYGVPPGSIDVNHAVTDDVSGTYAPFTITQPVQYIKVGNARIFDTNKHYYFPIPQSDMDLEPGVLIQNPNW